MNQRDFVGGMGKLAVAASRKTDGKDWQATLHVYREALADLTDAEWVEAVNAAIRSWTMATLPPPGVLRRLAGKGVEAMREEAERLFQLILRDGWIYLPERGQYYDERKVREVVGEDGLAAFRAAGGSEAFTEMSHRDQPFVARRFVEAVVEQRQRTRPALPPGEDQERIGRGQAKQIVGRLAGLPGGKR